MAKKLCETKKQVCLIIKKLGKKKYLKVFYFFYYKKNTKTHLLGKAKIKLF
jgi:hypothetical protein